jgi:hypothetical protein
MHGEHGSVAILPSIPFSWAGNGLKFLHYQPSVNYPLICDTLYDYFINPVLSACLSYILLSSWEHYPVVNWALVNLPKPDFYILLS